MVACTAGRVLTMAALPVASVTLMEQNAIRAMPRYFESQKHDTMILRWFNQLGARKTAERLNLKESYVRSRYNAIKAAEHDPADRRRDAKQTLHD
jgi:dihydroorotate dehydrogenase